jgi:hypothetical protein
LYKNELSPEGKISTGLLGKSIRDRKRGRKDPADIINGSTCENLLSSLEC